MKLRKLISLAVTAAIVMANAVIISMPMASAAEQNTSTWYADTFNYSNMNYSSTYSNATDFGWYGADQTSLHSGTSESLYTNVDGRIAQISSSANATGSNQAGLMIGSTNSTDYGGNYLTTGYGHIFPGHAVNSAATGSWVIDFDFKPYYKNPKSQFAITLNCADGSVTGDAAENNIISCDGTHFYLGNNSMSSIVSNSITPDAILATSIGGVVWYHVRVYVDCEMKKYSVELHTFNSSYVSSPTSYGTSTLIARRSPISFSGDSVSFIKFSAHPSTQNSYLFVDDFSFKAAASAETNIYSEDFSSYTVEAKTSDYGSAMTTAYNGNCFFDGKFSPWRTGGSRTYGRYAIEQEDTNKVLKLGNQGSNEVSKMVYAVPDEYLLDTTKERGRGMLDIRFKIKPSAINANDGFVVAVTPTGAPSGPVNLFRLVKNGGNTAVFDGSNYLNLDPSAWYTVQLKFDAINKAVRGTIYNSSSTKLGEYVHAQSAGSYIVPNTIGGILFQAGDASGSYVYLDDIQILYDTPAPAVKTDEIVLKDAWNAVQDDLENVSAAVGKGSIIIPVRTVLGETISASNFSLYETDTPANTIAISAATRLSGDLYQFGDSVSITPSAPLKPGTSYTLGVTTGLRNIFGSALASAYSGYSFTTTSALSDRVRLYAVAVGGSQVTDAEGALGGNLQVYVHTANGTGSALPTVVIAAYYSNEGKLLKKIVQRSINIANGSCTQTYTTLTKPASGITDADTVKVFLWDGAATMVPYCEHMSFETPTE